MYGTSKQQGETPSRRWSFAYLIWSNRKNAAPDSLAAPTSQESYRLTWPRRESVTSAAPRRRISERLPLRCYP